VRVCSRGFCRITGGMEDRREPPTGLDRTGPRFVRAAIELEADSGISPTISVDSTGHNRFWHEPDQPRGANDVRSCAGCRPGLLTLTQRRIRPTAPSSFNPA
jgi:hypothetical protein